MLVRVSLCALAGAFALANALGQTDHRRATTTSLSVQQNNTYAPTGIVVLLSATVTSGVTPIPRGLVKFCDASSARCAGESALGTAQLDTNGVGAIHIRVSLGKHSFQAIFVGTPHGSPPALASSSPIETITIQQGSESPAGGDPQ